MLHERLELDTWFQRFPIQDLREKARELIEQSLAGGPQGSAFKRKLKERSPGGETISGPESIAIVEQLRQEMPHSKRPLRVLATDLFVFALGEPGDQAWL